MKHKVLISIILIINILLPCSSFAADNRSISWEMAVGKMDKYNNTLLNMEDSELMAKRRYDVSLISSKIDPDGISMSFMGTSFFYEYSSTVKLYMTQRKELFPEQMKLSWEIAQCSREITRNGMVTGLRGFYLGLYTSNNDFKLKQKKYDIAETIHKQNKIKHERGMITDLELSESEYSLLSSKMAVVAAERNYQNMQRNLNSFIGEVTETEYGEIVYTEKYDDTRLKESDYYINKALNERMEIITAKSQLSLLVLNKDIMENVPHCLNSSDIKKNYDKLIEDIDYEQLKLEQTLIEVEKNINEAFLDVTATEKNLISLSKLLDIQKSNLEKTKQQYEFGLISRVLFEQVQLSVEELENNYKAALYDYNTRLMRLENASDIGPAY